MNSSNYDKLIVDRISGSFDVIIPVGAAIALLASIMVYYSNADSMFVTTDVVTGLILVLIYLARKHLSVDLKIFISIFFPIALGAISKLEGGFGSIAMILFLLGNVMAVLFLNRRRSLLVMVLTFVMFIFLQVLVWRYPIQGIVSRESSVWFLQMLIFLMFLVVFRTALFEIRYFLFENINNLESAVHTTEKIAYYDGLTDLYNRPGFEEQLVKQIENQNIPGYIIFVSLRNLNVINVLYSEEAGDDVLHRIGQLLKSLDNKGEIFGRVGGNEFAVWSPLTSADAVKTKMQNIKAFYMTSPHIPMLKERINYCASAAPYSGHGSVMKIYGNASLALTYAKHHNIESLLFYDRTFEERLKYEDQLRHNLKRAVKNREIHLVYQPVVEGHTRIVKRVEALARWQLITECVSPAVFVPLTEVMNLSVPFGKLTVAKAVNDYSDLCLKYGEDLKISINISPTFLMSEGFVDYLEETVASRQISTSAIILEVTEEVVIRGIEEVNQVLKSLRTLGFLISLDDFGSGYSSLRYLTLLEVDELKIDKTFIDNIRTDHRASILVRTIIQLSESYGLGLVAEGVEEKGQLDLLLAMGCSMIQGYYFGRPVPLSESNDLLLEVNSVEAT